MSAPMPPEGMPQGVMQPQGAMPQGTMPQGMPQGTMPQGAMPQGMLQGGMPQGMPQGSMPQGMMMPGMMPGMMPQGMNPMMMPGMMPHGATQQGAMPRGAMPQPGMMPQPGQPGAMPQPGMMPQGMMQPGMMPQPGMIPPQGMMMNPMMMMAMMQQKMQQGGSAANPMAAMMMGGCMGGCQGNNKTASKPEVQSQPQEDKILPQVQELCDYFNIEDRWIKRLNETMRKRMDTISEDIEKLYETLETARSPTGLLTVKIGEMESGRFVGKVKPDKDVERVARKFKLDDHVASRLTELLFRRKKDNEAERGAKDLATIEQHLRHCKRPNGLATLLAGKLLECEVDELPDLTEAEQVMEKYKLDEDAKSKLREVVEKRAEDKSDVLATVKKHLDCCANPSSMLCKIARPLIENEHLPEPTFKGGGKGSSKDKDGSKGSGRDRGSDKDKDRRDRSRDRDRRDRSRDRDRRDRSRSKKRRDESSSSRSRSRRRRSDD